jgi:chemotaxis family two-component system sensor kinase Cph1
MQTRALDGSLAQWYDSAMDPASGPRATEALARVRSARTSAEIDAAVEAAQGDVASAGSAGLDAARIAVVALGEATKDLLVARAALEDAHRAREALFASVSHDLRNPLNTFAMSLGLLRDDIDRGATRAHGLLSRMERASDRMQQIIEDLLEASRIEAGKIELALDRAAVEALAREASAANAAFAAEKKLELSEGNVATGAFVVVDRRRTVEALGKVMAYAIRSCSERGTVRWDVARRGDEIVVDVTSFIRNHRPQPMSLDGGKGGVSLFIVRGLIAAQGGSFAVHVGEGTTFRITLPAAA